MIIYRITNTITQKSYIGQTKNSLKERWYHHCYDAFKRKNKNFKIYNAIRKYGTESWILETLENIEDINLLNEREQYWIKRYDTFHNGYNSTTGGDGGKIVSLETKEKMSKSRKGFKHSEESKLKMKLSHTGTIQTYETKQKKRKIMLENNPTKNINVRKKISEKKKGHIVSEETRQKISDTFKRKRIILNTL